MTFPTIGGTNPCGEVEFIVRYQLYWGEAALAALPYRNRPEIIRELFSDQDALAELCLDDVCWLLADMTGDNPNEIRQRALTAVAGDIYATLMDPIAEDLRWVQKRMTRYPRLALWWMENRTQATSLYPRAGQPDNVMRWFDGRDIGILNENTKNKLERMLLHVRSSDPRTWHTDFYQAFREDFEQARIRPKYIYLIEKERDREALESAALALSRRILQFPVAIRSPERMLSAVAFTNAPRSPP